MLTEELLAIICYLAVLTAIGIFSYRKHLSETDFIIGNRSMNCWLTALAAHASDMSSWLFMGYPSKIFSLGLFQAWAAIGLVLFMFLNWQLVAPKIRLLTEQYNSLTFSSFFESRLNDTSGMIRIFTAIMSLIFYTIYISAGLVGLGLLMQTLFGIDYSWGILLGLLIVVPYVFLGGFITLAWIDLFQGLFLMTVIVFVPCFIFFQVGGWTGITNAITVNGLTTTLFPNFSAQTTVQILSLVAGWGLGYFGQPHIVTKFMGIRDIKEISKSKWIGMSWMSISLFAATFVGLVGIAFFSQGIENIELVFVEMVRKSFPPFVIGIILCAVIATTINATSSQVLVISSNITEDFYKKIFRKSASSKELLIVARMGVILVGMIAFIIAFAQLSSIYSLVLYAWSGLGASFGPLLLLCLYWKGLNKYGAWAGILSGGTIAGIWPYFNEMIPPLLPGFICSFVLIMIVSIMTRNHQGEAG